MNGVESLDSEPRSAEGGSRSDEFRATIDSIALGFKDGTEQPLAGTADPSPRVLPEDDGMAPDERATLIRCVEEAMDFMGQTGKEVYLEVIYRRYGIVVDDAVKAPGKFMDAMEQFHGSSALILERHALDKLEQKLHVSASSLEEAVAQLGGKAKMVRSVERKSSVKSRIVPKEKATISPEPRFEYHFSTTIP